MDDLKCQERDSRFEWCLVEISLYNQSGVMTDWIIHGNCNASAAATVMHLITKRTPKPHVKPLELYNSLMKVGPPPMPRPPVPGPPPPSGPHTIVPLSKIKLGKKSKYASDSSDSDSDGTIWSSDSSVGNVRRRLRKYRARKMRGKGKRYHDNSDSDMSSDSEDEDVIKVDLELKRGDNVVTALLSLWTAETDIKGKGKEKAV